jgi:phosphomannomutase
LNDKGEFLSAKDGKKILALAENAAFSFSEVDNLGKYTFDDTFNDKHIEEVLNLNLVDIDLVQSAGFKVVVDAVNSTGGFMIPRLLERMGVECVKLYCEPNGKFPHNPEPLPKNLTEISKLVVEEKADFGIVVDPDVDRLAMVCEDVRRRGVRMDVRRRCVCMDVRRRGVCMDVRRRGVCMDVR